MPGAAASFPPAVPKGLPLNRLPVPTRSGSLYQALIKVLVSVITDYQFNHNFTKTAEKSQYFTSPAGQPPRSPG